MRVLSNSTLEVLEVSGDDAGEYVCMVDVMGETFSKTQRFTIAGKDYVSITTIHYSTCSSSPDHILSE